MATTLDTHHVVIKVGFIELMLKQLKNRLCVDLRRIYAVGQSNGGMMTEQLALDARTANIFAAGVQVSGAPLYGHNFPPVAPFALLSLRGLNDSTIPYSRAAESPDLPTIPNVPEGTAVSDDGFFYVTEELVMQQWAKGNNCTGQSQVHATEYDEHLIQLQCRSFGQCAMGTGLVSCTFLGGHSLPWNDCSSDCISDWRPRAGKGLWWNHFAWNFMKRHPKQHVKL